MAGDQLMKKIFVISVLFSFLALSGCYLIDRPLNTAYEISEDTFNGDNVIYNYEWFKQTKEDIEANYNKTEIAKQALDDFVSISGDKKDWDWSDKEEYNRLNTNYIGLKNFTEDLIAKYNARAKMANRNIFEDGTIPDVLEFGSQLLK